MALILIRDFDFRHCVEFILKIFDYSQDVIIIILNLEFGINTVYSR